MSEPSEKTGIERAEEMAIDSIMKTIKGEFEHDGQPIPPDDQLRAMAEKRLALVNRQPSHKMPSA